MFIRATYNAKLTKKIGTAGIKTNLSVFLFVYIRKKS